MEIDAAQYASIAREMQENGSFLEVYHRGRDYLDKPPLLFWLSAMSFSIFGVSNFAYKLPAVLVLVLGIFSTYRLAKLWYSQRVALNAALITASCQALFLITNDIRTDGLLTGFVLFSVWQLSAYLQNKNWKHLLLGAIGVAFAMIAKGPIGLVIPAMALGTDLLLKRDWKGIFKWQWLVFLVIIALFLLPMCYGLYQQFDLHPEKEVYGLKGPSGVKFFFWTQSFGRIVGDIYWENSTGYFYFLQTMLWDFQPWVLLFFPAFIKRVIDLFKLRFKVPDQQEFITFGGFLLPFVALSFSNYKLPHYIFPTLPFAAILLSKFLAELPANLPKWTKGVLGFQFAWMHLFFAIIGLSFFIVFLPTNPWLPILMLVCFGAFWFAFLRLDDWLDRLIFPTIIASFAFGMLLSTHFYPNLMSYQSTSVMGQKVTEAQIPKDKFYYHRSFGHGLDFYGQRIVPALKFKQLEKLPSESWIFTDQKGLEELTKKFPGQFEIQSQFPDFKAAMLNFKFIQHETRDEAVTARYLLVTGS